MEQGGILKKIMESVKELVNDANFDVTSAGISLQAMDNSHVALVALFLRSDGFEHYRADRNIALGINLANMSKVLKCAGADDIITLKSEDGGDTVTFMFENPKQTRISHFQLKLMEVDSEHLGIPDTDYDCVVKMPSSEFQRICREITTMGDTVKISATKEGVKFFVQGDIGNGSIICKQNTSVDEESESINIKVKNDVALTFALRYLNTFAKATPLSSSVTLKMSPDVPLAVEYKIDTQDGGNMGSVRFYLAPKVEDATE